MKRNKYLLEDQTPTYLDLQHAKKNGQLKKKPCEICDSLESQAHYEDYNKPLEVRWLCLCCHQAYHSYLKAHPNGSLEAFPMSL